VTLVVIVTSVFATEALSYLSHRFLMHGPGWRTHRSHHRPPSGGFERNDLFPLAASSLAIGAFAVGTSVDRLGWLVAGGVGMTIYGVAYLLVHEVYVHERIGRIARPVPYLEWLKRSHRLHHLDGGEPYGMLLPLMLPSVRRRSTAAVGKDPLPRGRTG
jgi:beta-carotene 3-hydroxylase